MEAIQRIKDKLQRLKRTDKTYNVFGSEKHRYKLNSRLSEKSIRQFEEVTKTKLPDGYREFLKEIGNGGAGPYYGLEPLENGQYADLHYKDSADLVNPSLPFPHTTHWNFESDQFIPENEDAYFDNKWVNGVLRISDFGCGIWMNMVVNGPEAGNIWVDSRVNDGGIFPDPFFKEEGRVSFLEWYELWLNQSLKEVIS